MCVLCFLKNYFAAFFFSPFKDCAASLATLQVGMGACRSIQETEMSHPTMYLRSGERGSSVGPPPRTFFFSFDGENEQRACELGQS